MATQLFKDGVSTWVETDRVQRHLQAGWSVSDGSTPVRHPDVIYPAGMELEKLPLQEAEDKILEHMGIVTLDGVSQSFTPNTIVPPVTQIAAPEVKSKRKYTRRK